MNKKRLLITISISFAVRYIVRTGILNELRSFCEPVIAITWNQDDLIDELLSQGFEVYLVPESHRGIAYNDIRRKIDIWFETHRLKSPSVRIQRAYLDQFKDLRSILLTKVRILYNRIVCAVPFIRKRLLKKEQELLDTDTNIASLTAFVGELNIDAVFTVTPFHRQEDLLLRACSSMGKQMVTSILSFDNITKRGWIPITYNVYMVWNSLNKAQLNRIYPETVQLPVLVTGAAQFDFYFRTDMLMSEDEWRAEVGITKEPDRKVILYAGGPDSLFPNEPQYLQHLDLAIQNGTIKGNPLVLFRCHPTDNIDRWRTYSDFSGNIIFDASWTGKDVVYNANVTLADIRKLCSTLAYTDVHINLCSTMTVDGSVFDKPQIGPAYDEVTMKKKQLLNNMYFQEHFLPVTNSGGLAIASSREQLISFVNEALLHPELHKLERKAILESVITYTDGRSAQRVVDCIKRYFVNETP